MENYIKNVFEKDGIYLDENKLKSLMLYLNMLTEYNKKFNITAIREEKEIVVKHFLDSAYLSKYIDMDEELSLIDVGTGGGFPGLVLKILFNKLKVTLLDSNNKKIGFLNDVIKALDIKGVNAVCVRSEDLARDPSKRESFDIAVSRAVAYLPVLSEYCIPLVKPNGDFIAMKNADLDEELLLSENAINVLGARLHNVYKYSLHDVDSHHAIVHISKIKSTPSLYPRSNSQIKKKML